MDQQIDFVYADTDSYQNEISEIYSYSEEAEFFINKNAFEESMEDCGLPLAWKHMVPKQQFKAINYLMTTLEVSCRTTRLKSCRALGYLIQGNFGECLSLEEQAKISQENVFILYEQGIFQAFVQQLLIEANYNLPSVSQTTANSQQQSQLENQQQQSFSTQVFNDSSDLRLILAVLCTITHTMYNAKDSTDEKIIELRKQFIIEVQTPYGDELLSITLFQMLNKFCGGFAPHYPMRKITLLLWKIILISLGGTDTLKELKIARRKSCNLDPPADDTIEVTKTMRPSSPLVSDAQKRVLPPFFNNITANKRKVLKQPAFDEAMFAYAKECLLSSLVELNQNDGETENSDDNGEFTLELNDSSELANSSVLCPSNDDPENDTNRADVGQDQNAADVADADVNADSDSKPSSVETNATSNQDSSSDVDTESTPVADLDTYDGDPCDETSEQHNGPDVASPDSGIIPDKPSTSTRPSSKEMRSIYAGYTMEDIDAIREPASTSLRPIVKETHLDGSRSDMNNIYKGLPWAPKVRKTDLSQHLSTIRQKFLGYTLNNDLETTFGLPDPIIEGIEVLRRHLYISLSELQLEREQAIEKYPLTHYEIDPDYGDTPAEKLYTALVPKLPQYMIALLKILLAASTSTKNKSETSESINIMNEMNYDQSCLSIVQVMKIGVDANRHKEIIIKSVSAILLLLLKHFKINHIYQFEYVSQQLMFANCIPLILKFLSQDIYKYIFSSKSNISAIDFPACVIGEQPELTTEAIQLCSFLLYSWRNMFSCINLVRILNKLTKWKHSRIMMLVVFKSSQTLTKALCVRHAMFQLYLLKLLKVQLKFLGRQWKKTNMKLISAIYQKVRHRLTDDWAYSNENEARPWDFQAEEFSLQADINKFHRRRYIHLLDPSVKNRNGYAMGQPDRYGYVDSTSDEDYEFDDQELGQIIHQFKRNYEKWLHSEVFHRQIDWDRLLDE